MTSSSAKKLNVSEKTLKTIKKSKQRAFEIIRI
jgi:ribosomal protein L28